MTLRDTAIVGYAETKIVDRSPVDVFALGAEILENLLDRTGFEKGEIDALLLSAAMTGSGNPFWSQSMADMLGLELDFCQTVDIGGCSPAGCVARAAAAIEAGLCETALLLYADTEVTEPGPRHKHAGMEFIAPYGLMGPPGAFGLLTSRYQHLYDLDFAALGKLAVAQRGHAILNDNACEKLRKPITVQDYLNSRMISDPIRLLDCVKPCDGASGLLMTSKRRAREKRLDRWVTPIGYGERTNLRWGESVVDITETGHRVAGARAFAQAGIGPTDLGSIQPYDDFIIAIMLQFEMLGFCKPGEGSAFIRERSFTHDGDLPLNTGGGQISAGQTGLAGGGTNLVEAVRQLFGEGGPRQVADTTSTLVTGIGGIPYGRNWTTSVALVLVPEA